MNKKVILWILGIFVLSSFAFADYIDDMNNWSISYYNFDSDATDSVASYDGTVTSATLGSSNGILNNAYVFDGTNDYITISGNVVPNQVAKSISLWFKTTNGAFQTIMHKGTDGTFTNSFGIYTVPQLNAGSGTLFGGGGSALNDGNWHHAVIVFDTNYYGAYIDSVLTITDVSGTVASPVANLIIGGTTYDFDGTIDEVAFFNETLNQTHVDFLYNSGSPTSDQQYPFPLGVVNLSITLNYPKNETIFTENYNGSIIVNLFDVNGTASCNINDSRWSFDSNNNVTYNFINNTAILTNNNSIYVNCSDSSNNSDTLYFWFYLDNRLTLNFYDELTGKAINDTIYLTLISFDESFSENYTISGTNGMFNVSGLATDSYELIYRSDGYSIRTFDADLVANQLTNLTLYLLNSSAGTNIVCYVYDNVGAGLEGYNVRVQKLIDGNYEEVEVSKTNFEGKTVILAETFTPYYKFVIEKDGVIYKSTSATEITATTINFYINLFDDISESYYKASNLQYTFRYLNATSTFEVDYVDPSLSLSQICLKVYKKTNYTAEVLYDEECLSTSSGTLNIIITEDSGSTYTAKLYASFSPQQYLDILIESFEDILNLTGKNIKVGMWVTIIMIILFAFIGLWNPQISLILIAFALWITRKMGLHELNYVVITSITVMCIVFAYLLKKE